jgi:catalase
VRTRMLGHLQLIEPALAAAVGDGLGMAGQGDAITPARAPIDLAPSPALSLLAKAKPTLAGRKVGVLISDGFDRGVVDRLRAAVTAEHATLEIVAPKIAGATAADGTVVAADHMISGGPSVIFDAVAVALGAGTAAVPPGADEWVHNAFVHCKVIGVAGPVQALLDRAGATRDAGVIDLGKTAADFIAAAKRGRVWAREGGDAAAPAPASRSKPASKPSVTKRQPKPAARSRR